jgi:hypothetical protein
MEPYYSTALSHFKSTATVASAAALTAHATANGFTPPPSSTWVTASGAEGGRACANCGGAPSSRCAGCEEGVDRHGKHSPTFYCGKKCQQEHWHMAHKADCKAANHRKQIYRAGVILQPVFETLRLFGWVENVQEVKCTGQDGRGKLLVSVGDPDPNQFYHAFPEEVFPDQRAKQVLLAHKAGQSAVKIMSSMLGQLLQGEKSSEIFFLFGTYSTRDLQHSSDQ